MRRLKPVLWALAVGYAAIVMIIGGAAKLMGYPMAHISFATMSLPVWFGFFIGICEVAGGFALLWARTRKAAAVGLSIIMAGALYFHVAYTPLIMGLPALLVCGACLYLALTPARPSA